MDRDPSTAVKEDYKDAVLKKEPRKEFESVTAHEKDPRSYCQVAEQRVESAAPSTLPREDELDIEDERDFEAERLDEIAFVAIKEEPDGDLAHDMTSCEVTEHFSEPAASSTEQEIERVGLVPEQEGQDIPDECESESEEFDALAFVVVEHETPDNLSHQDGSTCTNDVTSVDKAPRASARVRNKKRAVKRRVPKKPPAPTSVDNDDSGTDGSKPPPIITCEVCGYETASSSAMKNHLKTHIDEQFFQCTYCDFICEQKSSFTQHLESEHHTFICTECDFTSTLASEMEEHRRTHTEKPFACDQCSFRSVLRCNLKTHMLTHSGMKPFACNQCTFTSVQAGGLKRHMLTHTGEKPFSCTECTFRFVRKSGLKRHMDTHTGAKPFACSQCDYRCSNKNYIQTHMKTHTGERPFSCSQCSFRSIRNSGLKTHMLTHVGEKLFACGQCSFRCIRRTGLKRHMLTHTGEKPYACSQCEYRSNDSTYVKIHMRIHDK